MPTRSSPDGDPGSSSRCRGPDPARLRTPACAQPFRPATQPIDCAGAASLCAGGASAAARASGAQRLRPVERARARPHAACLRLSDRTVRHRAVAERHRASGALMSDPHLSEPHVLDQPWRVWASVAIVGILFAGILLGVVIIPVVQGRGAGLDAYEAICRALGIVAGSPAQPQPADRTAPTPVSQVAWTPDVLQILARADTNRGRAKVLEVCVVCHGEQGVSVAPEFPHLNGQ